MNIIKINNEDERFYSLIGPFLGNRKVNAEIGFPVYNDDGKVWIIAFDKGSVIGFCTRKFKAGRHILGNYYVVEEHRKKGVFSKLMTEALKGIDSTVSITTKNTSVQDVAIKNDFIFKADRGSFKEYWRTNEHEESGVQHKSSTPRKNKS